MSMKKIIIVCMAIFIFTTMCMNEEIEEKNDETSETIDRTYEHAIKDFWNQFPRKTEDDEETCNKHCKENQHYYIMRMQFPSCKNLIYPLKTFNEETYKDFSGCNEEKSFLFLDKNDEVSPEFLDNFDYARDLFIMEGSLDTLQESLLKNSENCSNFIIRCLKSGSYKNVFDACDLTDWISLFSHDQHIDKENYIKNATGYIKRFVLQKNVKLFLGLNVLDDTVRAPRAINLMYYKDDMAILFTEFEKYIESTKDVLYKKKMILEALSQAPKGTKKFIVASCKDDEKFYESIGMKKTRTLLQYNYKQ